MSMFCGLSSSIFAQAVFAKKAVNFNLPNGPYTSEMLAKDFGNGKYFDNRGFAKIENNVYKITFKKGVN